MALYSRSEFGDKCGLKKSTARAYIGTNIKRGKIILSGKFIDDSLPENAEFLRKEIEKNRGKQIEDSVTTSKPSTPKVPDVSKPVRSNPEEPEVDDPDYTPSNTAALDRELKQRDLEKKREEIRLLEIREQKLRGEVVPTEEIKDSFKRYSHFMVTQFDNTLDRIFAMAASKFKVSNEQMVSFKAQIRTELNKTTDIAADMAKSDFAKIIQEHKEARSRGERK